jgi:RHS repeat-associated protein
VVVTKYYFFGGQRIARRSSVDGYKPFYLHADQLGSTVLESNEAGAVSTDQKYHAYGTQRDSGKVLSEQRFTGQREDDTGLVYMNARYYDPQLGQFISPDTLVPQPQLLVGYNRYLYALGNPIKYSDPTGHYSVEELQQHFGVNSFDELMALFEMGGQYEGLEGWYDILRYAQDGDTITASNANENMGLVFIGTFMRTADGKIQIDMGGSLGIAPEISFAYFGGLVRIKEGSITGFGTYELRGQEYAWTPAIAGGRRYGDMQSCANVDCVAAGIDGVGVLGSLIQVGSGVCGPYAGACYTGGRGLSVISTIGGVTWTAWTAFQGGATAADMVATVSTTAIGSRTRDPRVSLVAGYAQFVWDAQISPLQR